MKNKNFLLIDRERCWVEVRETYSANLKDHPLSQSSVITNNARIVFCKHVFCNAIVRINDIPISVLYVKHKNRPFQMTFVFQTTDFLAIFIPKCDLFMLTELVCKTLLTIELASFS